MKGLDAGPEDVCSTPHCLLCSEIDAFERPSIPFMCGCSGKVVSAGQR